ncbi:hypothetical protein C8R45DRAFT_960730 [Mycena sanguinolenta]|nr:hypothetical protein C8R45DRAFT_960730 [Mycena sanguinolenta]
MPLLRSLDFLAVAILGGDDFNFLDVPRLRTVILQDNFISQVRLPWIQLTCLTLIDVQVNQCVRILTETLNLVQCTLFLNRHPPDGPIDVDLALPCLESLTLKTRLTAQTTVENFFQSFVVPCLHRLELEEAFLGEDPILPLESFVSKSGCRLQEVCVRGDMLFTEREAYCQAFPSIPTFSFPDASEGATDDDESESKSESDDSSSSEAETEFSSKGEGDTASED